MIELYGIPNCDTVKKAQKWLRAKEIEFQFHDFKKEGAPLSQLKEWASQTSWETLLNRKGTTWRQLDEATKTSISTQTAALKLMEKFPSLIKRPVVFRKGKFLVNGFEEAVFEKLFF